jgi:hypothetical protein
MPQLIERDRLAKFKIRDVSDRISLADVKTTPFTSSVSKGSEPSATLVEWPVDKYPDPTTEGAVDEADVQPADYEDLSEPGDILQGRIQIWQRKPRVSSLANLAMAQTGVPNKKAFARAIARAMIMIKRDMEVTVLSDNESRLGTNQAGYRIRGLGKWIQSEAQTDLPVAEAYRTPAASIYAGPLAAYNDDALAAQMQSIYEQTGDSDMSLTCWCGSALKRQVSRLVKYDTADAGLTLVRHFNENAAAKIITQKVDILDTDFGRVTLRLSSFINTEGDPKTDASKTLGYIVPMEKEMLRLRFAKNPAFHEHPDLGGGPRGHIDAIGTLEVGNPLCLGKVAPVEPEQS